MWLFSTAALAGESLPDRLAARATAPDVVLIPPVGQPSPRAGAFLIPYAPKEGQAPDPLRVGTYDVGPSSCSDMLQFETVGSAESREELWLLDAGIGANVGLPQFAIGVGAGVKAKSIAGIQYEVTQKLIVTGGLDALEQCCLRSPEKCTDRYVSEVWRGAGSLHRLTSTDAGIKTSLKYLDKLGKIDFGTTKGWSMASSWPADMYFAYRTSAFQAPSCASYMNDLPELDGKLLFTGVSQKVGSEQDARRDAQEDARQQVVRYLGEELRITGDSVSTQASALLSGVKDSLTCLDPVSQTPEGPAYLARVRMYVDRAAIDAAAAATKSTTGSKPR
ncbi:MAG: hypothetical protein ABMA64_02500 [Myxococcota bacterium]